MTGPAAEVLANLRGKLEGFQEHLPLIKALRNPGLRDRHWDKISQSQLLANAGHAHELHLPMAAQHCCATETCIHSLISCPNTAAGHGCTTLPLLV